MPQQPDEFGDRVVNRIQEIALGLIELFYEEHVNETLRRPFHNRRHTQRVIARADMLQQAICFAEADLMKPRHTHLVGIGAACHDLVQLYPGTNEQKGFECARHLLAMIELIALHSNIRDPELQILEEAIMATVAVFDPELGTAIQPNLTPTSHPVARIIALADLGAAGMDGPTVFLEDGNRLFREMNPDIAAAYIGGSVEDLDRTTFCTRMISWSNGQPKFAAGRRDRLDFELEGLPRAAAGAVRSLFREFDASIEAAERRAEVRRGMSFEELIADFGIAASRP